jgi:hypothetical protein
MTAQERQHQLRNRLMIVWMLLCAFLVAGVSIWIAATRPAPGFKEVSSVLVGGAMMFAAVLIGIYLKKR